MLDYIQLKKLIFAYSYQGEPCQEPVINACVDFLARLVDLEPRLDTETLHRHFSELFPHVTIEIKYLPQSLLSNQSAVLPYLEQLHCLLNDAEVASLLKEINETQPFHPKRLFSAIGDLKEFAACGMYLKGPEHPHGLNKTKLKDLLAISYLLKDTPTCSHLLEQLEHDIANSMKLHPKKIMSHFFFEWSKNNKFNQDEIAILHDFVSNVDDFFDLMKNKLPFKDTGANGDHGAWSHLIQFYLIIETNKKQTFLTHDPIELYEYLAEKPCRGTTQYTSWRNTKSDKLNGTYHAWDILFDRFDLRNFRSPNEITQFIFTHHERLPVLNAKIKKQHLKKSENKYPKANEPISIIKR